MGTTLILFGLVLLAIAAVGYLFQRPQAFGEIPAIFRQGQPEPREGGDMATDVSELDLSPSKRLPKLKPGHIVEILLPDGLMKELVVQGKLSLHEHMEYGRGNWRRSGVIWHGLALENQVLLVQLGGAWYLFDTLYRLASDAANEFVSHARAFGEADQKRGVGRFRWQGQRWEPVDIGRFEFEVRGEAHRRDGDYVRFLLAEGTEGAVLLVEDAKSGLDAVWEGRKVNPDEVVTKIL